MAQLTKTDLAWAVRRLPPKLKKLLESRPGRLFVAGGYLRSRITGEKVSDIDVFAPTKEEAKSAIEDLLIAIHAENGGMFEDPLAERDDYVSAISELVHETDNAYTAKGTFPMVQAIHRWTFDNPIAAIESFDFTIAKAAIWWTGSWWESVCHPEYYADLAAKRLVYTSPVREEAPGGSLLRVLKFYQRGYRIPLDSLSAVLARLMAGVDMAKVDSGQVIGKEGPILTRERAISFVLCGLLREVDPNIDPEAIQPLAAAPESEGESHE